MSGYRQGVCNHPALCFCQRKDGKAAQPLVPGFMQRTTLGPPLCRTAAGGGISYIVALVRFRRWCSHSREWSEVRGEVLSAPVCRKVQVGNVTRRQRSARDLSTIIALSEG